MNNEVIITCAVTGAGDTAGRSDKVPVTPKQIAEAAIEAAKAGAAVAHCHVRNPKTGKEVPISPRRVMVFKPSAILKHRINTESVDKT